VCSCAFDSRIRRIDGGLASSVSGYDGIGEACPEHPAWPGDFPRALVKSAGFDIGVSDAEFRNGMFEAIEVINTLIALACDTHSKAISTKLACDSFFQESLSKTPTGQKVRRNPLLVNSSSSVSFFSSRTWRNGSRRA